MEYLIQLERADKRGKFDTQFRAYNALDAQKLFQRARATYPPTHRVRLIHRRADGSLERAKPQFGLA